jgi:signal transduction histidine kinase
VVALWPALAASNLAWIAVACVVAVAATRQARAAAAAFAITVGGVSAGHRWLSPGDHDALRLLYEAGLVATASILAAASARLRSRPATADAVVELGETTSMRDALRRVLGDPALELAFARNGDYIDERGRPLPLPPADRQSAAVDPSGRALVVHGPSIAVDGLVTGPVWGVLRLTAENACLQADVLEQLAELRASRRRLVLARGRQRALVARRLREGAERHLSEIEARLAAVDTGVVAVTEAVARARRHVGESRQGIASLALGLQPPALAADGLAGALVTLAERSPVPVELRVNGRRFDAAIEQAAYLVCSEALANVSKHAGASRVVVRAESAGGRLTLDIADDGRGGADPAGSGLNGLRDRVEELGGALRVVSEHGAGTRIIADIPVGAAEVGG